MKTQLGKALAVALTVAFGLAPLATHAASQSADSNTVPISTVIAAVAKRSGKKFIVDPRVQGDAVLLQGNAASLSYDDFLMLMNVHGFAAVTTGDYVRVVPEASVRQLALPIANGDNYSPAEYVTRIFTVKSIPSSLLVPLLRPLIPQQGHMVAMHCTSQIIIVDTFANTQRLEQVIKALDRGEPYVPEKCKPGEPVPFRPADKSADKSGDKGADKGSDR
jgi:type II secretory pathway component GspD/PulD (secretin)